MGVSVLEFGKNSVFFTQNWIWSIAPRITFELNVKVKTIVPYSIMSVGLRANPSFLAVSTCDLVIIAVRIVAPNYPMASPRIVSFTFQQRSENGH